ncbi:MAG: hypothetical protein SGCHY_004929, partial [Lobulomycetales sp.]
NGGFEQNICSEPICKGINDTFLTSWNSSDGGVHLIQSSATVAAPEGTWVVSLNNNDNIPYTLTQRLEILSAEDYLLSPLTNVDESCQEAEYPGRVLLGTFFSADFIATEQWTRQNIIVTGANSPEVLGFTSAAGRSDCGPLVDDVRLLRCADANGACTRVPPASGDNARGQGGPVVVVETAPNDPSASTLASPAEMGVGAIVGIAVGAGLLVLLLLALLCGLGKYLRKRSARKRPFSVAGPRYAGAPSPVPSQPRPYYAAEGKGREGEMSQRLAHSVSYESMLGNPFFAVGQATNGYMQAPSTASSGSEGGYPDRSGSPSSSLLSANKTPSIISSVSAGSRAPGSARRPSNVSLASSGYRGQGAVRPPGITPSAVSAAGCRVPAAEYRMPTAIVRSRPPVERAPMNPAHHRTLVHQQNAYAPDPAAVEAQYNVNQMQYGPGVAQMFSSFFNKAGAGQPPAAAPVATPDRSMSIPETTEEIEYIFIQDNPFAAVDADAPRPTGSFGPLPMRTNSDKLLYGTGLLFPSDGLMPGALYMLGLSSGGAYGFLRGLRTSSNLAASGRPMPFKLRFNAIINQVTRYGPFAANSLGVLGMSWAIADTGLQTLYPNGGYINHIGAAVTMGALFKSTAGGIRPAIVSAGIMGGIVLGYGLISGEISKEFKAAAEAKEIVAASVVGHSAQRMQTA